MSDREASAAEKSAADVATTMAVAWMRANWSGDLSGKQQDAIVVGVMRALWPSLKAAAFHDMADAVRANPNIPNILADGLDEAADDVIKEVLRGR